MKKLSVLAASVVAAMLAAPAAYADDADGRMRNNVDFHGYMRAGVGMSRDSAEIGWQINRVGRLGNESDTYGEMELGSTLFKKGDVSFYLDCLWAMQSNGSSGWDNTEDTSKNEAGNNNGTVGDSSGLNVALEQLNIQVKGLIPFDPQANLWVGKKFYQRQDVHIIDQKYVNVSGNGAGLENLHVGPGQLSLAWIRKDRADQLYTKTGGVKTKSNLYYANINVFDVRYAGSYWDGGWLEFISSTYVQRDAPDGYEHGYDIDPSEKLSVLWSQSFSGGYNKVVLQFGWKGAAFTTYQGDDGYMDTWQDTNSAFAFGFIDHGDIHFGDSPFSLDYYLGYSYICDVDYTSYSSWDAGSDDEGNSWSGGYTRSDLDSSQLFRFVIRPSFQLTTYTRLLAEIGFFVEKSKYKNEQTGDSPYSNKTHSTVQGQKYTLAYAIAPTADILSRPEVRFYASYYHGNKATGGFVSGSSEVEDGYTSIKSSDNYCFGVQAEAWW